MGHGRQAVDHAHRHDGQLITSTEMTSDDDVVLDLASWWFEDLACAFDQLSTTDRSRLAALPRNTARHEPRSVLRAFTMNLPERFGLEDDEDSQPAGHAAVVPDIRVSRGPQK